MDRKRKSENSELKQRKKRASSPPPPEESALEITISNAVIKGYHIYQRRPLIGLRLNVVSEHDNQHDKNAMAVFMPALGQIPVDQHDLVTDVKRRLTVRQIAGTSVGHLPASLASILSRMVSDGEVTAMTCVATGPPRRSFWPWPEAGQKGGGPLIPCQVHVQVKDKGKAMATLGAAFSDLGPEKTVLTLL
ncbi:uncharacterized protein [Branchiostoma lanceolatum]|uniref:uncharacterized protein n=1 Tax=Branchiostoma lanceolatum TaxID=7740 RepID=UPI0034541517